MSPEEHPAEDALMRWMLEYQSGRLDAFERLYDATAADVRAYLLSLTRDGSRAEDLVQETYLQVHRSRASHLPGRPVRPWLFAIARRVFLMARRSASRRARHEVVPADPGTERHDTGYDDPHARGELRTVLQQVPPDRRRAFLLHHLHGYSFEEVGERLGVSTHAAKARSSRAAQLLRALLRRDR